MWVIRQSLIIIKNQFTELISFIYSITLPVDEANSMAEMTHKMDVKGSDLNWYTNEC